MEGGRQLGRPLSFEEVHRAYLASLAGSARHDRRQIEQLVAVPLGVDMSKIGIVGVTGYVGGNIANEALRRGHEVIGVCRSATDAPAEGMELRPGSIEDRELLAKLFTDSAVVVVAVHGAVEDKPFLPNLISGLLALAGAHSCRLGVVGGAGSLRVAPDGPRLLDSPDFPAAFKAEASSQAQTLDALQAVATDADWFYVCPPIGFGPHAPGERRGHYRTGDDVFVYDGDGKSEISGEDFAIAFLDEIEHPAHRRRRFTVAY